MGRRGSVRLALRSADPLADRLQGMRLADDAFLELGPQVEDSLDLVGHHLADRNAGPTGDDLGNRLGIDRDLHQRRLSLQLAQLCDLGCQLRLARCQFRRGLKGLAIARMLPSLLGVARLDPAGEFADLLDAFPLVLPASLQVSKPGLGLLELVVQLVDSFLIARAGGSFALKDLDLHLEVVDVAPVVFDRGRYGVLADRHAGAGGIDQADGLVGQLPGGDVAMRQFDGTNDGLLEDSHAMVLLQDAREPTHHANGDLL